MCLLGYLIIVSSHEKHQLLSFWILRGGGCFLFTHLKFVLVVKIGFYVYYVERIFLSQSLAYFFQFVCIYESKMYYKIKLDFFIW